MPRGLFVIGWMAVTALVVAMTFSATAPDPGAGFARTGELLAEVEAPVLLLPEPDGTILMGERSTGRILRVNADGSVAEDPVAEVDVTSGVGLLGLAHDDEGRLHASWLNADRRLVVGRVGSRGVRPIWRGPRIPPPGAGGRLARLPEGRLLVAVGHIGEPDEEPNGRLLSLDPTGDPDQEPQVRGSGLSNPTALAVDESGIVWVTDAAGEDVPQALLGVSPEGDVATVATIPETDRVMDLALQGGRLYACGSSGLLFGYLLEDLDGEAEPEPVASDCALSVAPLEEGLLVYAGQTAIRTIRP